MELDINGAKILFTLPIDLPVLGPLRISETMVVSWIVMRSIVFAYENNVIYRMKNLKNFVMKH